MCVDRLEAFQGPTRASIDDLVFRSPASKGDIDGGRVDDASKSGDTYKMGDSIRNI